MKTETIPAGEPGGHATEVFYTRTYPVPFLRHALRTWIRYGIHDEYRGQIADAIQGHSDGDRVSVRAQSEEDVRLLDIALDALRWTCAKRLPR